MPELRHLNLSHNPYLKDLSVILEMKQLRHLEVAGLDLTEQQKQELRDPCLTARSATQRTDVSSGKTGVQVLRWAPGRRAFPLSRHGAHRLARLFNLG